MILDFNAVAGRLEFSGRFDPLTGSIKFQLDGEVGGEVPTLPENIYLQPSPDEEFSYLQPDGVSFYTQPA